MNRLARSDSGAILVEFGLVLPFLLLMLGTSIELTRMWMVNRSFESTVDAVGRMAARFPEYDSRVRAGAPILASELFRGGEWENINMKVDSVTIKDGAYVPVFENKILLGKDPGGSWRSGAIPANDMINFSSVIYITASYDYVPLLSSYLGGQSFSFNKTLVLRPYFSRQYEYNAGQSPDAFVY